MKKLLLLALLLFPTSAFAQASTVTCNPTLTETAVLSSFADNVPGGITPRNLRDYVCSQSSGTVSMAVTGLTVNSASQSNINHSISTAPTYTFPVATATYFNGDFSNTVLPISETVSGACTLGCPTTGYQNNPTVAPYNLLITNTSGHNQSVSSNTGRTAINANNIFNLQNGQGDMGALFVFAQTAGATLPGETSFLAGKAVNIVAASIGNAVAGSYLQGIGDIDFTDNGNETAAIGLVFNYTRTISTQTYGSIWFHEYVNSSSGTQPIDAVWVLKGPAIAGLDTTQGTTSNMASVNLAAGQRIYLNSTAAAIGGINWYGNNLGSSFLEHDTGNSEIEFFYNNAIAAGFTAVTSAVNFVQLKGAATGVGPNINAIGTDTNIQLNLQAKGSGGINFQSNGVGAFFIFANGGAVNSLETIATTTGIGPQLIAIGSDPNIQLNLAAKNSGGVNLQSNGVTAFFAFANGGASDAITATAATSPTAPSIGVTGGDSNININFVPKGSGTLQANGVNGVNCSGSPTASFATSLGIVVHC